MKLALPLELNPILSIHYILLDIIKKFKDMIFLALGVYPSKITFFFKLCTCLFVFLYLCSSTNQTPNGLWSFCKKVNRPSNVQEDFYKSMFVRVRKMCIFQQVKLSSHIKQLPSYSLRYATWQKRKRNGVGVLPECWYYCESESLCLESN